MTILIVTHPADPHVEMVSRHLGERGTDWVVLPAPELGEGVTVSWQLIGDEPEAWLTNWDDRIDLRAITSVWNRRMLRPHLGKFADRPLVRQYAEEQWWHALQAALRVPSARWFNTPAALEKARSKPVQLVEAHRLGLHVPPTLVSAEPTQIRDFAEHFATTGIITKVVSPGSPIVTDDEMQYMVFTQRIDPLTVPDETLRAAPAIYQPELAKDFEVRVTIVDDDVFGCRIDSGASASTSLDWRHYDFDHVAHDPIQVPADIEARLHSLVNHFGLRFAAVDFVVQPDGSWAFLEVNANGQWGWIEEQAGLPIGKAVADALMRE